MKTLKESTSRKLLNVYLFFHIPLLCKRIRWVNIDFLNRIFFVYSSHLFGKALPSLCFSFLLPALHFRQWQLHLSNNDTRLSLECWKVCSARLLKTLASSYDDVLRWRHNCD